MLPASAEEGSQQVRELVVYELKRLSQFDDPRLLWVGGGAVLVALIAYVVWVYRREFAATSSLLRWVLPGLRMLAVAGLVLYFVGIEKRYDQQIVTESQVLLLIDTSQSMSITDEPSGGPEQQSRSEAVAHALEQSPLIETLRREHNVEIATFDDQITYLARFERRRSEDLKDEEPQSSWIDRLRPRGAETRLGDALETALDRRREGPLAGVVLFSDGGQNLGTDPMAIAEIARQRQVPLYAVGVGSTLARRNLRVQEVHAPSRVYPGDKATFRALIQGEGFAGRSVEVQLFAREGSATAAVADLIGQKKVTFDQDPQILPLQFEIEPAEVGLLILELRIVAPSDDQYAGDDRRELEIEVVDARSKVMLLASAATRDYRFLRNQLRRDRSASVDVWLQSAQPGISQDADLLLEGFPRTKEELYPYDCIVAFDPDWTLLDAQQVDLLESWIADEAGGLIVVAGPIHTASWVQSPEHAKIRALYPVEFQNRLTLLDDGVYGSATPWPILFSREGEESEFLWLSDSASESRSLWSDFEGVYGCYAVKGPKPGARVLGRYSDPDAGISADLPVYFAEQFYGGGRVFYMGSGELWRLRKMSPSYFEILTTNLIRHVSQGRLIRGSSQGQLLVERDRYSLGEEVVVRAHLLSQSREPLLAPRVTARVVGPDDKGENLEMRADVDRPGNFVGQLTVRSEGIYRIELPVPDSSDEPLVRRIQVVAPNLEFDKTRRNESLLGALAARSGGAYYTSLAVAVEGRGELRPVSQTIPSRAEQKIVRGTPDLDFTRRINQSLLAIICGALCLEWLLRRLSRLA